MSKLSKIIESNFNLYSTNILLEQSEKLFTWKEIDNGSNHIAYKIFEINNAAPSVIFIDLNFGNYFLSTVLACIKLGAPYVPIFDKINIDSQRFNNSVVVDSLFINTLRITEECKSFKYVHVEDTTPLYGIMTSGTTGEPKIPLIPHNAIINLVNTVQSNIQESDIWSCIHAVTFGFSTFEYFLPLAIAKKIVALQGNSDSKKEINGPISLAKYIQEGQRIDVACLTPTGLTLFQKWLLDHGSDNIPKYIILSGEPLTDRILTNWNNSRFSKQSQLISTFATAESGGQLFWNRIQSNTRSSKLGLPLPYVHAFILDEENKLIDGAGTGRLAIFSDGIAVDNLSNGSEIPRIFIEKEGLNALLLDDIVERTNSNEYFFAGRTGSKIKYNGYFLNLDEISDTTSRVLGLNVFATLAVTVNDRKKLVSFAHDNHDNKIEIWPALGEFNEYDAYTYNIMTQDGAISKLFKEKIEKNSKGNKIIDLGCGGNLIISKLAIDAGAEKVYAYEIDKNAYQQAKDTALKNQIDTNRLDILCKDVSILDSIPNASHAITRIFGNIASADGLIPIAKNIQSISQTAIQWLPEIAKTKISCVDLPILNPTDYVISPESESFFRRLEKRENTSYRGRLCIRNFNQSAIISSVSDFEILDFNSQKFFLSESLQMIVSRDSNFSGLILWVSTLSSTLEPYDDYLDSQKGWLPVYIPLPASPISVLTGDIVSIKDISSDYNSRSPDYNFCVEVSRHNKLIYSTEVSSKHSYSAESAHYALLDNLRLISRENSEILYLKDKLRTIRESCQDKQLPEDLILLKSIPLTKNAKIDKIKLEQIYLAKDLEKNISNSTNSYRSNQEVQEDSDISLTVKLGEFITEVTNSKLLPTDNFFEAGLTSLDIVSISAHITDYLGKTITLSMVYDNPSCEKLAEKINHDYPEINNLMEENAGEYIIKDSVKLELSSLDFKIFASQSRSNIQLVSEPCLSTDNATFILSPPRSGSTLLRVLLAGVNSIVAPPELELLRFNSLNDWSLNFSDKDKLWKEGLVEFLMYIFKYTDKKAFELIDEWILEDISIPELYNRLLSYQTGMYFVEKSTYYSLFPATLLRIKTLFPNAKIIHLVRNPIPCISSYSELRLDTYSPVSTDGFTPSQSGELIWTTSHQNILEIFGCSSNYKRVFYEDLVNNTSFTVNSIIKFLGIDDTFKGNLDLSKENQKLMINGINDNTIMLGDPNFFKHSKISKTQDLYRYLSNTYNVSSKTKAICEKLYDQNYLSK